DELAGRLGNRKETGDSVLVVPKKEVEDCPEHEGRFAGSARTHELRVPRIAEDHVKSGDEFSKPSKHDKPHVLRNPLEPRSSTFSPATEPKPGPQSLLATSADHRRLECEKHASSHTSSETGFLPFVHRELINRGQILRVLSLYRPDLLSLVRLFFLQFNLVTLGLFCPCPPPELQVEPE